MTSTLTELSQKIIPVLQLYQIRKAGIFGSFARGSHSSTSDVDLMVDAPKSLSLLDMIKLQQDLEDKLNRKVDVVEYDLLKSHIKVRALREEVRIL